LTQITWIIVVNFEHVIGSTSVFLPYRITCFRGEVEGVASHPPGGHDPLALLEVVRHVGSVALVAGMNVL
jgi:hypothetical protein